MSKANVLSIVTKFAALTKVATNGSAKKRPLWLAMSPLGAFSPAMGKSLRAIPAFDQSIQQSASILQGVKVDLNRVMYDEDLKECDVLENVMGIISVEIALIDALYGLGVKPDGIFGHSMGEIGAGYADGELSRRQALLTAHTGSSVLFKNHMVQGALYIVGLSREEALKRCPPDVYVACSNGANHVVIAGLEEPTVKFARQLEAEGVMAIFLESGGTALHTPIIETSRAELMSTLGIILPEHKKRNPRWLSTFIQASERATASPYLDASYYTDCFIRETMFHETCKMLPQDAVVVEVGPASQLVGVMRQDVGPEVTLVPLLEANNNDDNLDLFVTGLAEINNSGHTLDVDKMFHSSLQP
ncbi:Fatty acid synthase [Halotydeus destructor]|nr:Fatty acid synthase [Halotydeus destructor]